MPVRVPRVPPCDREESSACHALQTSMTGTNGRAWPRRAVSARTRFITNSDAVRVAGRPTSKRRASSTVLVSATPAIVRLDRQRRERPVGRGSPGTGHRRRVGPLSCAHVIGVAFSVATSGVVAVVREGMLAIPSWVAARVPTRAVDATGCCSNRGVHASRSGVHRSPRARALSICEVAPRCRDNLTTRSCSSASAGWTRRVWSSATRRCRMATADMWLRLTTSRARHSPRRRAAPGRRPGALLSAGRKQGGGTAPAATIGDTDRRARTDRRAAARCRGGCRARAGCRRGRRRLRGRRRRGVRRWPPRRD